MNLWLIFVWLCVIKRQVKKMQPIGLLGSDTILTRMASSSLESNPKTPDFEHSLPLEVLLVSHLDRPHLEEEALRW